MKCIVVRLLLLMAWALSSQAGLSSAAEQPPPPSSAAEKRFPPLEVPPGFKATLFAHDPLIEYPSVISAGPRPGAVFVAVDYMTGLGTEIVRRSEVRLIEDTDGDGMADNSSLYAGGFNSIMGLAYHDGALYVMHAPLLTVLRDTKQAGVADERRDLIAGLGLTPEENPVRLHCANGVTVGHDGWLYLALGDHGCNVMRPEGDRLILEGGGILRCRSDGRDLHVFATGLRNIYDVALDAELNVFVRDNENDGGDYKVRFCQSFFGADHGYPYLYNERPQEALRPLADLGLGSSAGGTCYLETAFPPEYRGNAFFCEWGKSLVRYPLRRRESGFAPPSEIEFATGGDGDPYGFKPTDVVIQRDGTLMVSDYADGQRPKRGRGRIYHISYIGGANFKAPSGSDPLAMLDSESYFQRCDAQAALQRAGEQGRQRVSEALAAGRLGVRGRWHAIWILAQGQGREAIEPLMGIAQNDPEVSVRTQAVRAIADLADPALERQRTGGAADKGELAARLATLAIEGDPQLRLEIFVALSRMRWPQVPAWLQSHLHHCDETLAHAVMQALRRSNNWGGVLKLLDGPSDSLPRRIALRAVAGQQDAELVDGLLDKLSQEADPIRAGEYAECLARVYKRPGPWTYWGYRPAPRPGNTVTWEKTEAIGDALNRVLSDGDPARRLVVLQSLKREKIPARPETLGKWLAEEQDAKRMAVLLDFLGDQPAAGMQRHLEPLIRNTRHSSANRLAALALWVRELEAPQTARLLALAGELEDGPVLVEAFRLLSLHPKLAAAPLLAARLDSRYAEVRAAAIRALGELHAAKAPEQLLDLLADTDAKVRRAAAGAAGKLGDRRAIERLMLLSSDPDPLVRDASLEALRALKEPRAVPQAVRALSDSQLQRTALHVLQDLGGPEQLESIAGLARRNPTLDVLSTAVQVLTAWQARSQTTAAEQPQIAQIVAEIQGASGTLVRWHWTDATQPSADAPAQGEFDASTAHFATGSEGHIVAHSASLEKGQWLQAWTEIAVSNPTDVVFLASSNGGLRVWLNGAPIHRRDGPQRYRIDSDRFSAALNKGTNRLVVAAEVVTGDAPVEFHVRFRPQSAVAEHERLLEAVLGQSGSPKHGREVLLNVEKSLCLKCHRVDDRGERFGPELTGLGSRLSRIYIAESILEPSRTIAPSFGAVVLALGDGRILTGIKVEERDSTLTLADPQGMRHVVPKSEIDEQQASPHSAMPVGLEKRLTEAEFVDLVAYLASLRKKDPPP